MKLEDIAKILKFLDIEDVPRFVVSMLDGIKDGLKPDTEAIVYGIIAVKIKDAANDPAVLDLFKYMGDPDEDGRRSIIRTIAKALARGF